MKVMYLLLSLFLATTSVLLSAAQPATPTANAPYNKVIRGAQIYSLATSPNTPCNAQAVDQAYQKWAPNDAAERSVKELFQESLKFINDLKKQKKDAQLAAYNAARLAFYCVLHPRLGVDSPANVFSQNVVQEILLHLKPEDFATMNHPTK